MTPRRFCIRPYDDRGTSLVLALVFITVVSLVVMTVLAFADTSMRTTIALRGQVSETAAAEGAANIAINTLRDGTFGGSGSCFGGSSTRTLSNFYQRPNGTQDSARVTCDLDPNRTTAPAVAPGQTLLTLHEGTTSPLGPAGIVLAATNASQGLRVAGNIYSNSTIVVPAGNLTTAGGTIGASRSCPIFPAGSIVPTPSCKTSIVMPDPLYDVPSTSGLPPQTVPPCTPIMTFQAGHYTDVDALINRTSTGCQSGNGILHFTPGIYHFDFPTLAMPWFITAGTLIAGNLAPGVTLTAGIPPAVPGSCKSPVPLAAGWTAPDPSDGVLFYFSGNSGMSVSASAKVELCGRYGGTSPSLAIVAERHTGLFASLCDTSTFPCAAVWGTLPKAFQVNGTVYLPNREVVLTLNNSSFQSYKGGVIARRIWVTTSRTSSTPVIEVPTSTVTQRQTVVYLNVYVCPGSSTCAGGQLQLRSKVSIVDPTRIPVAGERQMTVLSWSLQG
jgi:hypothetical protein